MDWKVDRKLESKSTSESVKKVCAKESSSASEKEKKNRDRDRGEFRGVRKRRPDRHWMSQRKRGNERSGGGGERPEAWKQRPSEKLRG